VSSAVPPSRSVTSIRPGPVVVIDGLLAPRYARRLIEHWESYRGYGLSSDGGTPVGRFLACSVAHRPRSTGRPPPLPDPPPALLTALGPRADATANFVRTGGRLATGEDTREVLHTRTNYLRATYVMGVRIYAPVMCRLLNHPVLADAATRLFDRPVVVPTEMFANVMLPGQELGVHTDVPQFRGAARGRYPLWLLVVMQHSGLFEAWRIHLATAVLHLGRPAAPGGEFAYYPDGPDRPGVAIETRHNTALVLDTDTVLHGVDRVGGADDPPDLPAGVTLRHREGRWRLHGADGDPLGEHAGWSSAELRYSISWKAQCFADEDERRVTRQHTDDLTYDLVMARLLDRLPTRAADLPPERLGRLLIDTYVRFPADPVSP
jgi:hypothetical protein